MKIKPIGNRLVLKLNKVENKMNYGIIMVDVNDERPKNGEVVAISKQLEDKNIFKIGDKVIYNEKNIVTLEKEKYILVDVEDILAIIEE